MTKTPTITERISRMYRVIAEAYSVKADVVRNDPKEKSEVERLDAEAKRVNDLADRIQPA